MPTPPPARQRRGRHRILLLGVALAILATLALIVILSLGRLIEGLGDKAARLLATRPLLAGVQVTGLDLAPPSLDLAGPSLTWQQVVVRIGVAQGQNLLVGGDMEVRIAALTVTAAELLAGNLVVTAQDISAAVTGEAPISPTGGMTALRDGQLRLTAHIALWPPAGIRPQIEGFARELRDLAQGTPTALPLEFSGITSFRVRQEVVKAALATHRDDDGRTRLTMDRESLQVISKVMGEQLTAPELELLAANPLQSPRLLRIRDQAQETAYQAHAAQEFIPEDAYRHVLWSYLLTKAYGEKFATAVTDAHEQGGTDNSEAERQMDYANNAAGRRYAGRKVKQEELLGLLLNDPAVIRTPGPPPR